MRHRSCGDSRIAIIGAGPAGLSAAHFLKRNGYQDVLVLEKLGRVGGMCRTITEDYRSFDLGANYLTPAYHETLRLAGEYGMDTYGERLPMAIELPEKDDSYRIRTPFQAAREKASFWQLAKAAIRYTWKRFWLRKIIDRPGFAGISQHPDLCVSFEEWLERHDLLALKTLFEFPITIMGYGHLHEIAAPYALKYMSLFTFVPMMFKVLPITSWIPWPKRFVLGYQRLWEAMSWELNVRTNVDIKSIKRKDGKIHIKFHWLKQVLNEMKPTRSETFVFDHLIVASPLGKEQLGTLLDQDQREKGVFKDVHTYSYCLSSFNVEFPDIPWEQQLFATIPITDFGQPWAITRQMEDSTLMQFYSRLRDGDNRKKVEEEVIENIKAFVRRLNGRIDHEEWHTYDRWPYFQHVHAEDMRSGFYDRLEGLQGHRDTYYTGGLMNFELVEQIIAYNRHLIDTWFPPGGPRRQG